jgi:hypothetical protein
VETGKKTINYVCEGSGGPLAKENSKEGMMADKDEVFSNRWCCWEVAGNSFHDGKCLSILPLCTL